MPRRSSVLLINEPPLQALPSLACLVGINGAIILQQIHYWIQVSEHQIEGYTWIYNSYNAWAKQFKWLKPHAVQWHIRALEKSGYLISRQFKYKAKNNTKWYRIDYEKLDAAYMGQIDYQKTDSDYQKTGNDYQKTDRHSTKNRQSLKLNLEQSTQKTTQKTITGDEGGGNSAEPSPTLTVLPVKLLNKLIESFRIQWGRVPADSLNEVIPREPDARDMAQLRDLAGELSQSGGCPLDYIRQAFGEAAGHQKRHISYVRKILLAWLGREGNRAVVS